MSVLNAGLQAEPTALVLYITQRRNVVLKADNTLIRGPTWGLCMQTHNRAYSAGAVYL